MAIKPATNELSGVLVGPPVTGEEFFDRDEEMQNLVDLLERRAHVALTAPRRIGKTSLLLEAENRLADRFAFLFVDLEACTTEIDAIVKLAVQAKAHRDVGQKALDGFRNVFSTLRSTVEELSLAEVGLRIREGLTADWRTKADGIVDRLADVGRPVVVCFDELPVLVSALLCGDEYRMTPARVERGRLFLSWLREATIRCQGRISFVVAGSIGLEPLLGRAGISETMTTFTPLAVGPWERATALEYLRSRASRSGMTLSDNAGERVLDKLGYLIPHHLALFLHHLLLDARRRGADGCSPDDVDRVYEQHMLSPHGHVDLATYEDRLKRVVGPEVLRVALELLTEAAVAGRLKAEAAVAIVHAQGLAGQEGADALRFLLGVFEHDGYLRRSGEEYVFVSHLLRDWWKNRFGFGYVPADRR